MKNIPLRLSLLAIALLGAACTSAPTTSMLERARDDYRAVQQSPMAATYAPLETKQAGDALAVANAAADSRESQEKIDHLAYLAQQKISLTRETIKQKSAEAEIAQAGKQRDQLLLDQRTAEADQSKIKAQLARTQAADAQRSTQLAQNEAAQAKQNALIAKNQSAEAKQDLQAAQAQAAGAQRQAQEAQRQAQDAKAQSAQLEAQLTALAAKNTARGMVITLGDVLFGTDLSRMNADGIRNIQKLATLLQDNPQRTVLVEGFTDSTGSAAHNQTLSERRANTVQSALVDLGVAKERVAVRGYGEELPVAANDTAANRQLNRRVEIVLSDDKGKVTPR
jgi:outer membrane protein OmpA-like peptidoglycan-associated protein